ncbi:MAG: hypothetical protein L3J69_13200, partial [Desulfobacula sp.]|nr:hypothetical protein [Desulfobacula sp.]
MRLRLKDIIDLEYLARLDDDLDTVEENHACRIRDRDIYSRVNGKALNRKTLLLSWLAHRKIQYLGGRQKKGFSALPGTFFSKLYSAMIYIMAGIGFFSGLSLVTSFLAYHGNQPVNVTLFISVFILLPPVLIFLSLLLVVRKIFAGSGVTGTSPFSGVHSFLTTLMFKGLPKFLQKFDWGVFKKSLETIE